MNFEVLSHIIITKVFTVSTVFTPKNTISRRNDRPNWAIVIKYEGETEYTSNGKQFISNLDHIIVLPKGCSYDWICTKAGHFYIIEFESEATLAEPISFSPKNSARLLNLFRELEYKRNLKSPGFEMESIAEVYSILLKLIRSANDKYVPGGKKQRLQPVIDYISQHYNTSITNSELAEIAGMSTVYFRKTFTEIMGISPIAYARQLRIEKAKEMLKSDYGTLSDIACSLGYQSLYDFSRDFKRHVGTAPSKY